MTRHLSAQLVANQDSQWAIWSSQHRITTVDSSYYLDQLAENVQMIAFCAELCPLLLISISELWVARERSRAGFYQTPLEKA